MLGKATEIKKKMYLSINNGQVTHTEKDGTKQFYGYVEGYLEDVYLKDRPFNGRFAKFWYLDLRDDADLYSLCLPYNSGTFKSIILSLADAEALTRSTPIRIEPYSGNNGYTKVVVYADGVKLDWAVKDLPPVKEVIVNGNVMKDETERMTLITSLAEQVRKRLQ